MEILKDLQPKTPREIQHRSSTEAIMGIGGIAVLVLELILIVG